VKPLGREGQWVGEGVEGKEKREMEKEIAFSWFGGESLDHKAEQQNQKQTLKP
jgi:hypothetical protein